MTKDYKDSNSVIGPEQIIALNQAHWQVASASHTASEFYDLESLILGGSSLSAIERAEIGDISGALGIHLQCGIGLDTISLARCGAKMLGIDFSPSAIEIARSLATQCALESEVTFAAADVNDATSLPSHTYDFAYTSHGVLRWLPSLDAWARNVARLIKPGGFFYIFEIHPLVYRLTDVNEQHATLDGNYFDRSPKRKQRQSTHSGTSEKSPSNTLVHTDWALSDVVTSLIGNGLTVQQFTEHSGTSYTRKGLIPNRRDNLWYPRSDGFPIPLAFSLRCTRS